MAKAAAAASRKQQQHPEQQPLPESAAGEPDPQQQPQQHQQRQQQLTSAAQEQQQQPGSNSKKPPSKRSKLLSAEKLRRLHDRVERRGIVYLSRLPPHMKPAKLRQLLSAHGEIGRVYCTPEDAGARAVRKQRGGNSGKNFTEGWVEFEDKADAKLAAAALNGQQIGGKRRSAYHFDLWAIKYLPKFKWDHLTEEIAYEKAVREQRMQQELAAAKRERDFYLSRVDKAKAQDAMQARRAAKQQQQGQQAQDGGGAGGGGQAPAAAAAAAAAAGAAGGGEAARGGLKRTYGQRKVKPDPAQPGSGGSVGDDVLSLLVPARKQQKV